MDSLSKEVAYFEAKCKDFYASSDIQMRGKPWKPQLLTLAYTDRNCNGTFHTIEDPEDIISYNIWGKIPRSIVLSGPSGKSTFLKKLAFQWTKSNCEPLSTFRAVVLCSLKSILDIDNLSDTINASLEFFCPPDLNGSREKLLGEIRKHLLVLLDDYDVLSELGKLQVKNCLQEDSQFFCSTIVVATSSVLHVHDFLELFQRKVEILDLVNSCMNKIIEKSIDHYSVNKFKVKLFLEDHLSIWGNLQSSPLLVYSLCYVFSTATDEITSRSRELFYQMAYILLRRNASGMLIGEKRIKDILSMLGQHCFECFKTQNYKIYCPWPKLCIFYGPLTTDVIIKCGLFQNPSMVSKHQVTLHSFFAESLAVTYSYHKFKQFGKQKLIEEYSVNLNVSTSRLIVAENKQVFLAIMFRYVFWVYIKHCSSFNEANFETKYDSDTIRKASLIDIPVDISKRNLSEMLTTDSEIDLLKEYLKWKPESEVISFTGESIFLRWFFSLKLVVSCFLKIFFFCSLIDSMSRHSEYTWMFLVMNLFLVIFAELVVLGFVWVHTDFITQPYSHQLNHRPGRYRTSFPLLAVKMSFTLLGISPWIFTLEKILTLLPVAWFYGLLICGSLFFSNSFLRPIPFLSMQRNVDSLTARLITGGVILNHIWNHVIITGGVVIFLSGVRSLPIQISLVFVVGTIINETARLYVKKRLR